MAGSAPCPRVGGRTFLFLQGPHGSFFPHLGSALAGAGHRVLRVNFNGGDAATWPNAIAYGGTAGAWPRYVRRLIADRGVTDIALYGDARPLHLAAIEAARAAGARVHVFEEGYLRPNWVTMERDGVNGHSTLPRHPEAVLSAARDLPPLPAHPSLPSYAAAREWAALFYYLELVLQHWRFPFYRSHRSANPAREAWAFLRRRWLRRAERERSALAAASLPGCRYFLFPLQLDTDYQIRRHSRFGSTGAAIEHVLSSFAAHAPRDTTLAVKEHPLDVGLRNWRRLVADLARRLGIADRVVFLEQGDLQVLVDGSVGMVTVNSTSGTLALAAGKPVKVLGEAVYAVPGIADEAPLDDFWARPTAPDPTLYDAFCRVLGARCLLPGAFLSKTAREGLVAAAVARMSDDRPTPAIDYAMRAPDYARR